MKNKHHKIQILNVVGRGRSGSTLLEHIAFSDMDAAAVGELRLISMLDLDTHHCSCHSTVSSCAIWSRVIERLNEQFDDLDKERRGLKRVMQRRYQLLCFVPGRSVIMRKLFSRELMFLDALYRSVAQEFGVDTIIDSSKNTFYSLLLAECVGLDIYCIHLIRDPRAVWYSWKRQQRRSQKIHLYRRRIGILKHSFAWFGANFSAGLLKAESKVRYLAVKYEALAENPQAEFKDCISRLGLIVKQSAGRDYHSLSGNPSRHTGDFSDIKLDDEWKSEISKFDWYIVSMLTFPLLKKYKY